MFVPCQEYKEVLPTIINDFLENQISLNDLNQKFNALFLEIIPTECFSSNEFNFYLGLGMLLRYPSVQEVLGYIQSERTNASQYSLEGNMTQESGH
jgi:hypothetical protein